MKIVTKILNILFVGFALIGVYAVIMFFVKVKPLQEDYDKILNKNASLELQQEHNNKALVDIRYEIYRRDQIIEDRDKTIDNLANDLEEAKKKEKEAIEKLQNLSLEEVIKLITDYYGVNISEVEIVRYDNEIKIAFKEPIVRRVAETITKLEARDIEVSGYQKQVSEYELLVSDYECKVSLLEQSDSLNTDNYNLEKEKNTGLQEIIDNRNKKIKSIVMQRNIVAGVAIIVVVLVLI